MLAKLCGALNSRHRGQKGMTGLETAITLIASRRGISIVSPGILSAATPRQKKRALLGKEGL